MKRIRSACLQTLIAVVVSSAFGIPSDAVAKMAPGQEAFERYCHVCHPKGGNVLAPAKALHGKDLEKNGVLTAADIVSKMRNPGPAMTQFDEATIPNDTARAIAEYILKTFK